MTQPLSNKIGNCVGEAKRRLLDRLKRGDQLDVAVSAFILEVSNALREIVQNVNSDPVQH